FVILDNFDDNLSQESGRWTVRDPALAALLASWTGKLLITCRHPFSLGETAQVRLTFRRLGPLTSYGAAELRTSLRAIRRLAAAPGAALGVHRWTAGALHRRRAQAGLGTQLAAAHRQAAAYWLSRGALHPGSRLSPAPGRIWPNARTSHRDRTDPC